MYQQLKSVTTRSRRWFCQSFRRTASITAHTKAARYNPSDTRLNPVCVTSSMRSIWLLDISANTVAAAHNTNTAPAKNALPQTSFSRAVYALIHSPAADSRSDNFTRSARS